MSEDQFAGPHCRHLGKAAQHAAAADERRRRPWRFEKNGTPLAAERLVVMRRGYLVARRQPRLLSNGDGRSSFPIRLNQKSDPGAIRSRYATAWKEADMMRLISTSLLMFILSSCADTGLSPGEGFIDVEGGRVWYRIVGSGHATPLLLLHGGPGAPSYYLNPLERVSEHRPVIFYDQLGAGRSDRPTDTTLWRVDRFVRELAQVRDALDLDEVHILGHSWGSMLAVEYMLTNPDGVQSLILASPALSVRRWAEDAKRLLADLPDSLQRAIERHESVGTTDSPEYQEATMEYYRRYLSRSDPWSPDLDATFENLNSEIYGLMWGPSEFTATGSLSNYEREDVLADLSLPILFTAGRYDEATPETVAHFHSLAPNSEIAIFENSAHMTMLDEPEEYVATVREFLNKVDRMQ